MKIKRVFAWLLVLFVAYVTLYAYFHPDEIVYRVDDNDFIDSDIPKEPLVKETNPLVYYTLKYQWLLVVIGLLWFLIDFKKSAKLLSKIKDKLSKL